MANPFVIKRWETKFHLQSLPDWSTSSVRKRSLPLPAPSAEEAGHGCRSSGGPTSVTSESKHLSATFCEIYAPRNPSRHLPELRNTSSTDKKQALTGSTALPTSQGSHTSGHLPSFAPPRHGVFITPFLCQATRNPPGRITGPAATAHVPAPQTSR